jgi:hypothetical protein
MSELIKQWCARHSHPINAVLHVIGIPAASFVGPTLLFYRQFLWGFSLIVVGYAIQIIGHKVEGSQVGELMAIKAIFNKLFSKK